MVQLADKVVRTYLLHNMTTSPTYAPASEVNTLSNQFLSSKNGKVGLFSGARESANTAAKILATPYDPAQTLSLHVGDETHQLALSGSNGLLELVDVVNPTSDSIPQGQSMEWSTFVIDGQGNLNVKDGADIPTRRWVSFENTDGSYGVALYDGVTVPQARTLANISIVAVAAQGPATARPAQPKPVELPTEPAPSPFEPASEEAPAPAPAPPSDDDN